MDTLIHDIDKNNFFFDTISTLSFAQFGVDELFSRGFYLTAKKSYPNDVEFITYIKSHQFPKEIEDQIFRTQTFTPFIFVPGFTTFDKAKVYRMEPNTSAVQFVNDKRGMTNANIEFTHWAIISAWEKVMQLNLTDSPVLQFFRHIRNAAAHNGKFHFTSSVIDKETGQLKLKAEWGTFSISSSMLDLNLIARDKNDRDCFWDQGDLIEFFLDFENHYPELKRHCS